MISDPRVAELVDVFNTADLGGALMRYASPAISLRGWIGPHPAGGWAYEDTNIACVELPTVYMRIASKRDSLVPCRTL